MLSREEFFNLRWSQLKKLRSSAVPGTVYGDLVIAAYDIRNESRKEAYKWARWFAGMVIVVVTAILGVTTK